MKLLKRPSRDSVIIGTLIFIVVGVRLLSFGYFSSLANSNPSANPYPVVAGDSVHYAHWADNILALHAYQDTPGVPLRAAPPGYPLVLAGMKAVTGSQTPILIVQIFLAALAALLIYRMSRTLMPLPYAVLPALFYAVDPMAVFTDTAIMTDGLFSSLLVCAVYLAFFQSRLKGLARWFIVGLLIGILTMLRPIAEFLIIVFPALYLFREWLAVRQSNPTNGIREDGPRLLAVVVFLAASAIVVTPWMARNYIQFGSFEISPLGGHNLLKYDVRGFLAWRALQDSPNPMPAILVLRHADDPITAVIEEKIKTDLAKITPAGGNPDSYEGRLAFQYIMHDPVRYAYFHAVNTLPFFVSSSVASYGQIVRQVRDNEGFYAPTLVSLLTSLGSILQPESFGSFAGAIWQILPLALEIGFWALATLLAILAVTLRRREFAIIMFAVLVAYFAALTGPLAMARYRIPAEPYLLMLAAVGLYALLQRVKEKLRAGRT